MIHNFLDLNRNKECQQIELQYSSPDLSKEIGDKYNEEENPGMKTVGHQVYRYVF